MALIDRDNFITHLVWYGVVDEITCGELKKVIESCTVKDIYTKNDIIAMLKELQTEIEENVLADDPDTLLTFLQARESCVAVIHQKIKKLEGNTSKNDN